MTRRANARLAGLAYLAYIAAGITSMVVSNRAMGGEEIPAQLASIARHATDMRVVILLTLLCSLCAVVLGVTLYAITREQDPDLAMLGMTSRVIEGVNGATSISRTMGLIWLATATGAKAPGPESAQALGGFLLQGGPSVSAIFFAVGSTLFSWLLLRGRMIPSPLAWVGLLSSFVLVLGLPAQFLGFVSGGFFTGPIGWFGWMPLLAFEVTLAFWFLIKGVAAPVLP